MSTEANRSPGRTATGSGRDNGPVSIELRLNGALERLEVPPRRTLLDALHYDFSLYGTKSACSMGNCGACTVALDGKAVYACLVLAVECAGCEVTTIEALAATGLAPLQRAFIDYDALQCGYCTPGQIMSLHVLFEKVRHPSDAEIESALAGNLCRCGSYRNILRAARSCSERDARRDRDGD